MNALTGFGVFLHPVVHESLFLSHNNCNYYFSGPLADCLSRGGKKAAEKGVANPDILEIKITFCLLLSELFPLGQSPDARTRAHIASSTPQCLG